MTMRFKSHPVRLHGVALRMLCEKVYERDHGQCIFCGRYVPEGSKPHHVKFKSRGGGDTEDNLVMLCYECHFQVHHGMGKLVQEKAERLLTWLYDKGGQGDEV